MSMTLENLEEAANSLGLPMSRNDGVLAVRVRPYVTLRIREVGKSFETEVRSRGPAWVRTALIVWVGLSLGLFVAWHRRLDGPTLIVLAGAVNVVGGMTWVSWLASRTREQLFSRAYELQSRT